MSPSRIRKLLIFFAALAILAMVIISFSSIFGITELINPVRIDSAYVKALQINETQNAEDGQPLDPAKFIYNPEQIGLEYEDFHVKTNDGYLLRGWYFNPLNTVSGITILIIPDINESKISWLPAAKAFTERGFHVCCIDMRACGESEGAYFTMGSISTSDISNILDSLYSRVETRYISLFGAGTGAAIAIRAMTIDQRPICMEIQNCFATLTGYFSRYATHKWGMMGRWFFPVMKKELDKQMGFNSDSLNLQQLITRIRKPSLFLARAKESIDDLKETHLLYELSPAQKKEFVFFSEKSEADSTLDQQKEYYDKISAFISTSIPKKEKRTRFKKLVLNDLPVNDR